MCITITATTTTTTAATAPPPRRIETRDLRRRERPYESEIQALEKRVLFDVGGSALRPEPADRVLVQQPGDEVARVELSRAGGRGGRRELEGLFYDVTQRCLVRWSREGRATVDHFVDEDPEGPPVDRVAVGPAGRDLRRHVLVGPDEGA